MFLLRVAAATVFAAVCACCCFCAADRRTLLSSPPLQCLTFQNVSNIFLQPIETKLPVSHRISTGLLSSSSPPPFGAHTSLALICLGVPSPLPPHSGPPCSCCCVKITPLPLLTFPNVCAVVATFCCCLMLAFLVVCCFSCCSCCFCCRFCGLLLFMVLLLLLLLPILLKLSLLLLLLCCCFVAVAAAGAFRSPTCC